MQETNSDVDEVRKPTGIPTVYFDGSCPLCSVEIAHFSKLAERNQIRFVDVAADQPDIGHGLTQDEAMARFHVRQPDGSLLSGAEAFVALWRELPGWRWAARAARFPGAVSIMEFGYRMFLPIRPYLSNGMRRLKHGSAKR